MCVSDLTISKLVRCSKISHSELFDFLLNPFHVECGYLPWSAEGKADCGQESQSSDTGSTINVVQTRINILGSEIGG
jgi:hypothetical protein